MKTYKSRISIMLIIVIAVLCFGSLLFFLESAGIVIDVLVFLSIISLFFGIRYVIDGEKLKIYLFWVIILKEINIRTIRKIEPSRCILSSPAASMKRLAIYYNKYDVVYISPRNQEDFIEQISKINSDIQIR